MVIANQRIPTFVMVCTDCSEFNMMPRGLVSGVVAGNRYVYTII